MQEIKQGMYQKKTVYNINSREKRWIKWMILGKRIGCHQLPERSFFYKGYQFPVCARCTGVLLASAAACLTFSIHHLNYRWCILLCIIMFTDWLFQKAGIRESTNLRRFVTGMLGGYGLMTIQLYIYCLAAAQIAEWLRKGG